MFAELKKVDSRINADQITKAPGFQIIIACCDEPQITKFSHLDGLGLANKIVLTTVEEQP